MLYLAHLSGTCLMPRLSDPRSFDHPSILRQPKGIILNVSRNIFNSTVLSDTCFPRKPTLTVTVLVFVY